VVLSNTNEIHIPIFEKKFQNALKCFEKRFYSNEIHARKPEIRAFEIVLDYLKISPEKIIFLDDKQKNIEIANSIGMNGILVENFEQMRKELRKRNIGPL